jgi:hypothetical protein
MFVGSFLFFCIILAMILKTSMKFGAEAAAITGLLFFVFIFAITKDTSVALGAGAALAVYTL